MLSLKATTMDCLRVFTLSILALRATVEGQEFTFAGNDPCSKNMSRCTALSQEGLGGADVWDKYGITPYLNLPTGAEGGAQSLPTSGRRRRSVDLLPGRDRRQAPGPGVPELDPQFALLQTYASYVAQGLPLKNLCDFIDGMDFDKMVEGGECTKTVVANCPDKFGLLAQSLKGSPLDYLYVKANLCVKECENFRQKALNTHQCELLSPPYVQTLELQIKAAASVNNDTRPLCQNFTNGLRCVRDAGQCCPSIELSTQHGLPLILKPEIIQMCSLDLTQATCQKVDPVEDNKSPDGPAAPVGQGVPLIPRVHLMATVLLPILFVLGRV